MPSLTARLPIKSASIVLTFAAAFVASAADSEKPTDLSEMNGELVQTKWLVEDIANRGVIDFAQTTIAFLEDERVSGSTGCNSYQGGVTIDGNKMKFGLLAVTMRACPEALMDQERKFLEATEQVRTFEIADTGLLYLHDENGDAVLRLSKMK